MLTFFNFRFLPLFIGILFLSCNADVENSPEKEIATIEVEKIPEPKRFGFKLSDYEVVFDTVKRGDTFGTIMDSHGVLPGKVYQITQRIPDSVMNFRRINTGKPYVILKSKDSTQRVEHFVYQKSVIDYAVISLDSLTGVARSKPITIKQKSTSGVISSNLSDAIDEAGLDYLLANRFADIYQWSVDFFKLQEGDQFKLIYKEKYIDDTIYAGLESIDAALLKHRGREFYAFEFEVDSVTGRTDYFDEDAKTLRKFFLKAPLQFSRISSRYTRRRFHPVQRRWKAHKGTDYAAATNTPIWSTADGVVTKASYSRGNGNYVKVKHTGKYSTQYLHMSRRAVKVGQYVKQGEIIGYVGQTGLATGPHVCYRFWVNGRQVDPYKEDLPEAEPMQEELKPAYFKFIAPLKAKIDQVEYMEIM
ncbi:peptidoglycan DD-metalloendopeptidase family protein [Psychroflexus sediminis]|uniref:Murein DD-endopeptidase MepM and murein hydrolase activator NlpD, contain LysM domain n=1 Tax=Psychroflexus sediminis TaxID=470826 RepID=A0A1G7X5G9_9FLAO|nr:peptidoglycan DD-metalloendopeptidase family protein [Psychroflexus sediminis]SDG79432.1 Murein DD-endopeptidase MepM and murein hydrolase activator NlpD, contain LysM domain [Psychroflexus sediminis]